MGHSDGVRYIARRTFSSQWSIPYFLHEQGERNAYKVIKQSVGRPVKESKDLLDRCKIRGR